MEWTFQWQRKGWGASDCQDLAHWSASSQVFSMTSTNGVLCRGMILGHNDVLGLHPATKGLSFQRRTKEGINNYTRVRIQKMGRLLLFGGIEVIKEASRRRYWDHSWHRHSLAMRRWRPCRSKGQGKKEQRGRNRQEQMDFAQESGSIWCYLPELSPLLIQHELLIHRIFIIFLKQIRSSFLCKKCLLGHLISNTLLCRGKYSYYLLLIQCSIY